MPRSPTPPADRPTPRAVVGTSELPPAPPLAPMPADLDESDGPIVRGRTSSGRRGVWQRWSRIIHAYDSMAALLVVLFFGATGITLNHPEWTFGLETSTSQVSGALPVRSVDPSGQPQFLAISERIRADQNVRGTVTDFGRTPTGGFISYRGPGYAADATFDTSAGIYRVTIEQQGLVGVLNDLHKGRNTTGSWGWLIDLAGAFLVVIALSGLALQLVLRRRRRSTVVIAGVVAVGCAIWAVVAIH